MKIIKTQAKEIFTKSKLPGCDFVINPYVGCGHNCTYCYARFIAKWRKFGPWGTWVEAKENAPELVKNRQIKGHVFMSSICDAYQPIEKDLEITRKILENMDKNIHLSILTKSDLVLRDIDLFKKFKNIEVGMTINDFSGGIKNLLEPHSPNFENRIKALKTLHKNDIKTYAFISPIIPGLVDVEKLIKKTKNFVGYYWFEMINLRGAGKEFKEILAAKFPESFKLAMDKEYMNEYMEGIEKLTQKYKIRVQGIEKH